MYDKAKKLKLGRRSHNRTSMGSLAKTTGYHPGTLETLAESHGIELSRLNDKKWGHYVITDKQVEKLYKVLSKLGWPLRPNV